MDILVEHKGGMRFTAGCRGYTVVSGKGEPGDGGEDGMWPGDLFAASLGMCIAGYIAGYCRNHGIPWEGMSVEMDRESARAPGRLARVAARVRLPGEVSEKDRKGILAVADRCYITQSIVHGMDIDVSLEPRDE